ncbi:helix-turn-helix domain-containing protein [Streptomyces sp. AV19]|uniref:helix-turn-helix domain-containing protein n=1 Tax=Streptomyces sp. AV19 TaxID=2793068 RepID=UPI0018FE72B5|nr:helix-turn-helix domain-containing protein [Streptomyces sp. AV19]MBH1937836.1 helix-turn-helix domain-containing protein [Streptomyces sp. AV19]MDG4537114.1 helix-turn-helix domain-containing protein [Streptomyces sp. AV19]
MTEQRLQAAGMPRARGLAPLSDDLGAEDRVFAEHLRELRERAGMTSTDLAAALSVDATRLSRYLSGQSLPAPQVLTRLHQLLAGPDAPSVEAAARESRALLYAAARSRGPLQAHAYQVAEFQEKLQEQRAETARVLAALGQELEEERAHRQRAEREIDQLRQAGAADRDERIRTLEAERDAALRRVAELEGAVAQTGALLRLQQDESQQVEAMAQAAHSEVERWEDGDGGGSSRPAPEQDDVLRLSREVGVQSGNVIDLLAQLRDVGRDDEAGQIIQFAALNASPPAVGAFYALLDQHRRRPDADRLVHAIAELCPAIRLRQLAVDVKVPQPRFHFPPVMGPDGVLKDERWKVGFQQEERPFGEVFLPYVGRLASPEVLVQLVRAFRERDETDFAHTVVSAASHRSRAERRILREGGLPVPGRLFR